MMMSKYFSFKSDSYKDFIGMLEGQEKNKMRKERFLRFLQKTIMQEVLIFL